MPKITTLDEKLAHDLGDIYDAEHRFLEAQQEMLAAATDRNLKKMIKSHIAQSEGQIERLDRGFEVLGKKAKRVKCAAAAGLVAEGQKGIEDSEENPKVRDCLIAGSILKVEHYEISSYRCLVAAVELMGQQDLLDIFRQNLAEEEQTAGLVEESTPELLQKASGKRRPAAKKAPARQETEGRDTLLASSEGNQE